MSTQQEQITGSAPGKLWGGRFTGLLYPTLMTIAGTSYSHLLGGLDPLMVEYNQSIYYDRAFYAQDIAGSIAWARANHKSGILSAEEFMKIQDGLKEVGREWEEKKFEIRPGIDEDIHTANERRLSEIGQNNEVFQVSAVTDQFAVGKDIGGKLHTGMDEPSCRVWL